MRWLDERLTLTDALRLALLLMPLLMLGLTGSWWDIPPLISALAYTPLMLAMAAFLQFGVCLPIYLRALCKLGRLIIDQDTLVIVAATAAFALSQWRYHNTPSDAEVTTLIGVWQDAFWGASLVSIALLGDHILRRVQSFAQPTSPLSAKLGKIIVQPGELIAVDGVVVRGISEIQDPFGVNDVFPVIVKQGDYVHAGARNGDEVLEIEAQPIPIKPAETLQKSKHVNHLQNQLDWVARITLAIMLIGLSLFFYLSDPIEGSIELMLRALSLSAPLNLGLLFVAPISEVVSIARRLGTEIRDFSIIDDLCNIGGVVISSRGVLTSENLCLVASIPSDSIKPNDIIRLAASVAVGGHDPWGQAILSLAVKHRIQLSSSTSYQNEIGIGISAHIENKDIFVGNNKILERYDIDSGVLLSAAEKAQKEGRQIRWVCEVSPKQEALGLLVFDAVPNMGAVEAIDKLNRAGYETALLTKNSVASHITLAKHLKVHHLLSDKVEFEAKELDYLSRKSGPLLIVTADMLPREMAQEDIILPFSTRVAQRISNAKLVTIRKDPRIIIDLIALAIRCRRVILVNTTISYVTALFLAFSPLWSQQILDPIGYEIAMVLFVIFSSLSLRVMSIAANEIDEE